MRYFFIILAGVLADQIVKFSIRSSILVGDTVALINGVLHITHINNYGAAFSILQNQRLLFLIIAFSVCVFFMAIIIIKRKVFHVALLTSLSLISAGGMGNFIDRFLRGYVTDFIDFRLINFPVFNVADICVTFGTAIMIYYLFFIEGKQKNEE